MIRHLPAVWNLAVLEMKVYVRDWLGFFWAIAFPLGVLLAGFFFWFPPQARQFAVPGTLGMYIIATGVFSLSIGVTEARKNGTLKTYQASPLPGWVYIAAQMLDRTLIILVITVVLGLLGYLAYGLTPDGNLWAFGTVALLATVTMLGFGFLIAAVAGSAQAAGSLGALLFFFAYFASGTVISLDKLPHLLRTVFPYFPFLPLVHTLSMVWTGLVDEQIWRHLAVLAGWAALLSLLATRRLRWGP